MSSEGPIDRPPRRLGASFGQNDGLRVTTVALGLEPTNDVVTGVESALAVATMADDDGIPGAFDTPGTDLLLEDTPGAHLGRIIALADGSVSDPNLPPESSPENRSAYVREVYIRAATENVRELCEARTVPRNASLFIEYLNLLGRYGEYGRGAEMTNLIYETYNEILPERVGDVQEYSVLWLARIIDASWMHYAQVSSADRKSDAFAVWCERAKKATDDIRAKHAEIDARESEEDISLRKEFLVAHLRMELVQARVRWREGYHFGDDPDRRSELSGDALALCNSMLANNRMWLEEPEAGASSLAVKMVATLREDAAYNSIVAEARRAKAMMLLIRYAFELRMRDDDSAEEAAGEIGSYTRDIVAPPVDYERTPREKDDFADLLLQSYIDYFQPRASATERPPGWWLARSDQGRLWKIIGKHDVAHEILYQSATDACTGHDTISISRLLNNTADNLITLARKLIRLDLDDELRSDLIAQARRILENMDVDIDPTPTLSAPLFAQQILYVAIDISERAKSFGDREARRIARLTIAESKLNLIPLMPMTAEGREERKQAAREVWEMFRDERGYFESAEDDPAKYDSPAWRYAEAPMLARLADTARRLGIQSEINVLGYCGGDDSKFREAHRAIGAEVAFAAGKITEKGGTPGDRRSCVPGWSRYYELVRAKAVALEKAFPELAVKSLWA